MKKSYLVFIFTLTFTLTLICISINSYKLKSARKALFYGLFKFLYKRQNGKKADPLKRAKAFIFICNKINFFTRFNNALVKNINKKRLIKL